MIRKPSEKFLQKNASAAKMIPTVAPSAEDEATRVKQAAAAAILDAHMQELLARKMNRKQRR